MPPPGDSADAFAERVRLLLRDTLFSYAPAELRRIWHPESTERSRYLAAVTGFVQFLFLLFWLLLRLKSYMVLATENTEARLLLPIKAPRPASP